MGEPGAKSNYSDQTDKPTRCNGSPSKWGGRVDIRSADLCGWRVFGIAVVAIDWSTLASMSRVLFAALLALAVYMGERGWHAWQDLRRRGAHWQEHFVDDIGFTLIALFAGFVIISALDLGSPVWLVVAIGVLGVLVGRRGMTWAKMRVADAG